jgi:glycosyltransferase involved in cell wall biosynthesis
VRVLWLSHFVPYPPDGPGGVQRSHHLLAQAARRHEVHVVTLDLPGAFAGPAERDAAVSALRHMAASVSLVPLDDGGRARRAAGMLAAAVGGPSYWERRYTVPAATAHVDRLLAGRRFDLVQLETVFLGGYARALAAAPVLLNHPNVESHLLERRAARANPLARAYLATQARRVAAREAELCAHAAVNLTVSDVDSRRMLERVPAARVQVVANGVDVEHFHPAPERGHRPGALLWVGGMDWFPNRDAVEWTAEALWPALAADGAHRTLTVVGKSAPPAVAAAAARDARVTAAGFVDDVRPYMWEADIFLCPIRVGGGTRLKVLNVLAAGCPLVSTAIGVEGLAMVEDEHYLRAETPAEFVAQVRRLEGDPALRARLTAAGRRHVVEGFSWDKIGADQEAAYQLALAGGGPRAAAGGPARAPNVNA